MVTSAQFPWKILQNMLGNLFAVYFGFAGKRVSTKGRDDTAWYSLQSYCREVPGIAGISWVMAFT